MFSSLRSRLWLSYALLILTALAVVAVVLIAFLLRNPLLYRQTLDRLKAAEALLTSQTDKRDVSFAGSSREAAVAEAFDVRVVVYTRDGTVIRDTLEGGPAIRFPGRPALARLLPVARDAQGNQWLYALRPLPDGTLLMVSAPRPKVPLLAILTDELLAPLMEGGAIGLLLALLLAFVIARWVADPLQEVVVAARSLPAEAAQPVIESGPHEVRELTRAFNAMVARVQSGRRSQRDFVANVSHELKTPLTSIQGFSQAILDGTADTPEARHQAAEVIFTEASRMHRMVLDLLDLARLDAGSADLKMSQVDVRALLNGVVEKFLPIASKAGVQLTLRFGEDLPALTGDGDRLSQVFTNLVDNGLKFTPSGGSITLRAIRDRGEIQVAVDDSGMGMPQEVLAHIFDRFYQVDGSRQGGEAHGAGLGLAIVHEIVSAHGGRISVRSTPGRGTAFIVHLPLKGPSTAPPARRGP